MYVQTPRQLPGSYFKCYLERTANHQTSPILLIQELSRLLPTTNPEPPTAVYEFTLLHHLPSLTSLSITNVNSLKVIYLPPPPPPQPHCTEEPCQPQNSRQLSFPTAGGSGCKAQDLGLFLACGSMNSVFQDNFQC